MLANAGLSTQTLCELMGRENLRARRSYISGSGGERTPDKREGAGSIPVGPTPVRSANAVPVRDVTRWDKTRGGRYVLCNHQRRKRVP